VTAQSELRVRSRSFFWGKHTYLMGVLNVTPDSFSDGGDFNTLAAALAQARQMEAAGADIIDIGGQSTRPGAAQISLEEELDRVIPAIASLRQESDIPISVDTTRAAVAEAAISAGADIVNDISGGTFDPDLLAVAARCNAPLILMHIRGNPSTMQSLTNYSDLVAEICQFLDGQIAAAVKSGVARSRIIIDPGIGFAKTYEQNLELLRRLPEFRRLNAPLLVGPSRKSFIGHLLNQPDPKQRVWGTAAACCAAIAGQADILRVHDVLQMRDACRIADAIWRHPNKT